MDHVSACAAGFVPLLLFELAELTVALSEIVSVTELLDFFR
jgi:hypothetical protein